MIRVLPTGTPHTLLVDDADLAELPNTEQALSELKAKHGLPAHAPIGVDSRGEWLSSGYPIITGRKRLPRGFSVVRTLPNGMRVARHHTTG